MRRTRHTCEGGTASLMKLPYPRAHCMLTANPPAIGTWTHSSASPESRVTGHGIAGPPLVRFPLTRRWATSSPQSRSGLRIETRPQTPIRAGKAQLRSETDSNDLSTMTIAVGCAGRHPQILPEIAGKAKRCFISAFMLQINQTLSTRLGGEPFQGERSGKQRAQ